MATKNIGAVQAKTTYEAQDIGAVQRIPDVEPAGGTKRPRFLSSIESPYGAVVGQAGIL